MRVSSLIAVSSTTIDDDNLSSSRVNCAIVRRGDRRSGFLPPRSAIPPLRNGARREYVACRVRWDASPSLANPLFHRSPDNEAWTPTVVLVSPLLSANARSIDASPLIDVREINGDGSRYCVWPLATNTGIHRCALAQEPHVPRYSIPRRPRYVARLRVRDNRTNCATGRKSERIFPRSGAKNRLTRTKMSRRRCT